MLVGLVNGSTNSSNAEMSGSLVNDAISLPSRFAARVHAAQFRTVPDICEHLLLNIASLTGRRT